MQEKHLFEYAVIRIVPKVEREEFFNAGIILYCAEQRFLRVRWQLEEQRLRLFCNEIDKQELEQHLSAIEKICNGEKDSGPIGRLSLPDRFRWLTATRSTIVQTSRVHPGLCADAEQTLDELFRKLG